MKKTTRQLFWFVTLFIVIFFSYGYGLATIKYEIFPYQQVVSVISSVKQAIEYMDKHILNRQVVDFKYEWVNVNEKAAFAPRDGAGALVFKNRMWLIGGWGYMAHMLTNTNRVFNGEMMTNNEVWNSIDGVDWNLAKANTFLESSFKVDSEWEGRHSTGVVVYKEKMWVVGGDALQGHYQSDVWNSEDGKNWTWVNKGKPVPWNPRLLHYTVVFKDKIWVIGGQTLPQYAPANETYYSDIWTTTDGINWEHITPKEPSWPARGMIIGSVVYKDRVWILGGGTYDSITNKNREYYNDVWSSADGINWTLHTKSAQWYPRAFHNVAVFDGFMWILAGTDNNKKERNDVWFSNDGVNWNELPNTPWNPRHASNVFVYDNALWVVTGVNMKSDVWKLSKSQKN